MVDFDFGSVFAFVQRNEEGWINYERIGLEATTYGDYKLHINIPMDMYLDQYSAIVDIIKNEVITTQCIKQFKMMNDSQFNEEKLWLESNLNNEAIKQNSERTLNNTITLYIPENPDFEKIAELCRKIESKLNEQKIPSTGDELSFVDRKLSDHISFRRDTIFGIYISPQTKNPFSLLACWLFGSFSDTFNKLSAAMDKAITPAPAVEIASNLYQHPEMI